MSEDYEVGRVDLEFDIPTHGHPKGRIYSPEYPRNTEEERPVCRHSDRCEGCPYPSHGFVCWHDEDNCLRTEMKRITKKEAKRKHERNNQQ